MMYGRQLPSLSLLAVVCVLPWFMVACSEKYCFNDDCELDIVQMVSYVQESVDSLKECMKSGVKTLKEEIRSLKELMPATRMSTSTTTPTPPAYDCADLLDQGHRKSGVYRIDVHGRAEQLHVYCDMETDGGGWLVIQRRIDGSITFEREWGPYKAGFGNVSREFWLGNDNLHFITSNKNYSLRIDIGENSGGRTFAVYSKFTVDSEARWYTLNLGSYHGNAGNAFSYYNNLGFTTLDNDNDWKTAANCAVESKGGWWYYQCLKETLNGLYRYSYGWGGYATTKNNEMKIRPLPGL